MLALDDRIWFNPRNVEPDANVGSRNSVCLKQCVSLHNWRLLMVLIRWFVHKKWAHTYWNRLDTLNIKYESSMVHRSILAVRRNVQNWIRVVHCTFIYLYLFINRFLLQAISFYIIYPEAQSVSRLTWRRRSGLSTKPGMHYGQCSICRGLGFNSPSGASQPPKFVLTLSSKK